MKNFVTSVCILSSAVVLAACSASSDEKAPAGGPAPVGTPPAAAASAGTARLRVVHASPDAPKVDVYAKGTKEPLLRGLAFGETSAYLDVPAGSAAIELRAAPSTAADPVAYATGVLTLEQGAKITAVAAGLLSSKEASSAFRVLPLIEKFRLPSKGNAIVRVVHASADAPTVGIDVGNDAPQTPEINSLARFDDSGTDGVALPAGMPMQIGIAAGGTTVTAFTTPALPDGAEIFVIATGLLGKLPRLGDGFSLLAVGPNGSIGFIKQNPTITTLHASPDAPSVDAYVGATKIIDDLSFGKLSSPVQVPPGEPMLDLYGHADGKVRPSGSAAASKSAGSLSAGERYLSVVTGFLSPGAGSKEPGLRLQTYPEAFALDNVSGAQVRAVHASPDAPAVDIGAVSGTSLSAVLFPDLTFTNASAGAGAAVSAGSVHLGVTPAGQPSTFAARFLVPITSGMRAFAVAAGTLAPQRGNSFRLLVVETAVFPWNVTAVHPLP